MKVLVSGASGLVGRYIVEDLLTAGYRVLAGGRRRPPPGLFPAEVKHLPLSLDPDEAQDAVFDGVEAFVHAAFDHLPGLYRGGEGDDPAHFRMLNLDGSVKLFETARNKGVQRVIFLSSRAVYDGVASGVLLTEDLALQPTSLYGEIKLAGEQALTAMNSPDFITSSLRLTGVYGELRPNKWDGLFAEFLAGREIPVRAGSEVHGYDVGQAVRLMLECPGDLISGQSFNVSDSVADTSDILTAWQQMAPHPLPPPADKTAVRQMNTQKIKGLGWRPGGSALFAETLRRLAGKMN